MNSDPERGLRRIFFGCRVPPEKAQRLRSLATGLSGRAVPAENLHLTLAFLGRQPGSVVDALMQHAAGINPPSFTLELVQLGTFTKPGITWLGPEGASPGLQNLATAVHELCRDVVAGFDSSRWRPHITLCRKVATTVNWRLPQPISWEIDHFELVESHLQATGPEYRCLQRWPLRSEVH